MPFEHGFFLRLVKGLADDVRPLEHRGDVLRGQPQGVALQPQVGVDFSQVFRQGQGLFPADLACLVLLPVQVGEVHLVKVYQG